MKHYVIDTNIILTDFNNIEHLSDGGTNMIYVCDTVLFELDKFKTELDSDRGFNSREFGRFLNECSIGDTEIKDGCTLTYVKKEDITVCLVYNQSDKEYRNNDEKIVDTLSWVEDGIFLSNDILARTFAVFAGKLAESLHLNTSKVEAEVFKTLELDNIEAIENLPIEFIDSDYKTENYNYEFIDKNTGNKKYGVVVNGKIDLLDEKDFETKPPLKPKPVNIRQKLFAKAILDDCYDILVVDAKSGASKTTSALACAINLVQKGKYNGIYYLRDTVNTIDKANAVGFMSTNEAKLDPFIAPLNDSLGFLAKSHFNQSKKTYSQEEIEAKVEELKEKYSIEFLTTHGLQGRTFDNKIVIYDEMSNSTLTTLRLVVSRLNDQCKLIALGSNLQIWNPYLNKRNNALTIMKEAARESNGILSMYIGELKGSLRGRFAEFADRILI